MSDTELAQRIGRSVPFARWLLSDLAAAGLVVEEADGRWRLSACAERRYGTALRSLARRDDRTEAA
jgi:DNA-binding IclR family transcriptional regulator